MFAAVISQRPDGQTDISNQRQGRPASNWSTAPECVRRWRAVWSPRWLWLSWLVGLTNWFSFCCFCIVTPPTPTLHNSPAMVLPWRTMTFLPRPVDVRTPRFDVCIDIWGEISGKQHPLPPSTQLFWESNQHVLVNTRTKPAPWPGLIQEQPHIRQSSFPGIWRWRISLGSACQMCVALKIKKSIFKPAKWQTHHSISFNQ